MDINQAWNKAFRETEIIRYRVQSLMTFKDTLIPYIVLSESSINVGDTIVRSGEVLVERPSLILPPNNPQLKGFDLEMDTVLKNDSFINFLLIRGISLPSLKYDNQTHELNVHEDRLSNAIHYYHNKLLKEENVHSGLIVGPEDCWQLSVFIYTCTQIVRNSQEDIKKLLKKYKENP